MATRSPRETERHNRIRLAVAAYAYEYESVEIMSDAEFDKLAYGINQKMDTWKDQTCKERQAYSKKHDKFFRDIFQPFTGMWIRRHPDLIGIKQIYERNYKNVK